MKKNLEEQVNTTLNGPDVIKPLRKLRGKAPYVPQHDDPREELRRLVRQHKALVKSAVAIEHMSSDRKNLKEGGTIECRLPLDAQAEGHALVKAYRKKADSLKTFMGRELKKIPIYDIWLSRVFGARGTVVAAYLLAEIDIVRAEKPSNLRRFCGMAVIDGRLERRAKGQKSAFSSEMRMRLFQMFDSMHKNRRHAPGNKYLQVWDQYRHRIQHSERVFERGTDAKGEWTGKIKTAGDKTVSARGFAWSLGWHKAADVFLEDLYMVWRAVEGLPVWPSYYAAKLGYEHGGKISVNAPRMLSVEEAVALAGPDVFVGAGAEDEGEDIATAAE